MFQCPYCGREDIKEAWWEGVEAYVTRWNPDGTAAEYSSRRSLDAVKEWEEGARFHCPNCDATFDTPRRVDSEDAPSPTLEQRALALLKKIRSDWPQYDTEEEINGGDCVDWLGYIYPEIDELLKEASNA